MSELSGLVSPLSTAMYTYLSTYHRERLETGMHYRSITLPTGYGQVDTTIRYNVALERRRYWDMLDHPVL